MWMRNGLAPMLRGRATAVKACAVHVLQHVRFHNTSGVGPHGSRVARKVHHADVPHPRFLQEPKKCAVFGAPMTWGQPRAGTDNGPEMIRRAGLSQELGNLGWNVEDLGDLDIAPPSDADPQVESILWRSPLEVTLELACLLQHLSPGQSSVSEADEELLCRRQRMPEGF